MCLILLVFLDLVVSVLVFKFVSDFLVSLWINGMIMVWMVIFGVFLVVVVMLLIWF